MARYSDLVSDIRPSVVECANPIIEDYARRSVIEFCMRSRFWREQITIPLVDGQDDYEIGTVRPEGRPDQVLSAHFRADSAGGGRSIPLAHLPYSHILQPGLTSRRGSPSHFGVRVDGNGIKVWPEPKVESFDNPRIDLYVVAVPRQRSSQYPDVIDQQWREALIDGALWKLLMIPGKPWTNMDRASTHRFDFFRQVNDARRSQMNDGHAQGRTKLRQWR